MSRGIFEIDSKITETQVIIRHTIPGAWLAANRYCAEMGRDYKIDKGSFAGRTRRQLDHLAVIIESPQTRPFACSYNGQQFSDDQSVQDYFTDFLVSPAVPSNTQYTYGERIAPHIDRIAQMLEKTPYTNQAFIPVARWNDYKLNDPPCLQLLTWKLLESGLQLCAFFRSWDLESGFPTNAGGLQMLNELITELSGLDTGRLVFFSDGAHSYQDWSIFK